MLLKKQNQMEKKAKTQVIKRKKTMLLYAGNFNHRKPTGPPTVCLVAEGSREESAGVGGWLGAAGSTVPLLGKKSVQTPEEQVLPRLLPAASSPQLTETGKGTAWVREGRLLRGPEGASR